ncbi:redox-regulated ATPase YchF [soil metagenome]
MAANYPFATIEPNVGIVAVPDERLLKLAEIVAKEENPSTSSGTSVMGNLPPIKPATVEFLDIAGLVKGASEGAGLGNKFLSHIREVSVIAHVVRAFEDGDIVREGSVSPEEDYLTIQKELILSDLQTVDKALANRPQDAKRIALLEKLKKDLDAGKPASAVVFTTEEHETIEDVLRNLLTSKAEVIVLNVEESSLKNAEEIIEKYAGTLRISKEKVVVICAKVESDLAGLTDEEQKEYLAELGVEKSGLELLIKKAYQELGLISFLTAGEKEVRAWTTRVGATAPLAAGEIHTDFTKKFIKAEVVSFEDYVALGGVKNARVAGKARLEGKEYVMKDGDVVEFKIGA